ncbi:hypothetical protein LTS10_008546 [Elasticomyces elasticus]|nr:hypothetical protein LTS10_008546 [Elasticomyces elasticus]
MNIRPQARQTVNTAQHAEASISDLHTQIKANTVILFADQVSKPQADSSTMPTPEIFTIAVTRSWLPGYSAYLAYYHDGSFKKAASGDRKDTVLQALQGLLDTLADSLTARLNQKMERDKQGNWVSRGNGGEVMEGYVADFDGDY